ncbi:UNVERIFIED_CONTAM: hypothetical protein Slati_0208600 [Sesamum latifolium]|uniref:Uncharacterized protein n=1 Tax=Sesamum latifolium TaxID=2727402 RepID=A0AAW2YBJ4_9LAMI
MTRGFAPLPPGRSQGPGKMIRPLIPMLLMPQKHSTLPATPTTDEPLQSPLIELTPLGPSSAPPETSTVGGSFAPSPSPSSVSQAPTAPRETQARVASTQPNWLGDNIWHELQAYWNSDEFKAKSAKNKANRVANPVVTSTVYRGGSTLVGMHKRKLKAQLGRPPNRMEVFADCYKKKANVTWSGKLAEEVVKTYQKLLEQRVSQPASGEVGSSDGTVSVVQEDQLWVEAIDGRKRGRVFGMGSDALMLEAAQPWTTKARPSSSTAAPLPTDSKLDK